MTLTVLDPGPLATVQDLGRPGLGSIGVGRSGVADRRSARLANRLAGNAPGAALIEVTFGGLVFRADIDLVVALAGAPCPIDAPTRARAGMHVPFALTAGAEVRLGPPHSGLRTYVAVGGGGLAVELVLGSRSTDLLAGLGPRPLAAGDVVPVGDPTLSIAVRSSAVPAAVDAPAVPPPHPSVVLHATPGPRHDWFTDVALATLTRARYRVSSSSDRTGVRLIGPLLARAGSGELPSEGMVRGAIQVPPDGQPVLLLADHPVTGGYPVIAVVDDADTDLAAQLRPGDEVRLTLRRERAVIDPGAVASHP